MSVSPEPAPTDRAPPAHSHCDVCSVTREAERVLVHFGEHLPSADDPRVMGVALRHRVGLDDATAGRLQELLSELLATAGQSQASTR